jgi:hypothetical protein
MFKNMLMDNGQKKGIIFRNVPIIYNEKRLRDSSDPRTVATNVATLRDLFGSTFKDCRMVLVIIPKKNSSIYAHVKQASELMQNGKGILTQCVVGQNVFKGQAATVQNILLKVNSKLGGVNHVIVTPPNSKVIDMLKCPMLIIGADVTHPPPGSMIKVSEPLSSREMYNS